MTILITGATGFIGSAVINRLSRDNVRIIAAVLDGEDSGHLPEGIERITVQPLSENSDYGSAFNGVDIIIHLAARVHVMRDTAVDPLQEFRKINLCGTENLARQAAKAGVKRFIFISTVKVLGEENSAPYQESSPVAPVDPYAVSKAEAESALWRIAGEAGIECVVVRPPLVYGPGVKANFLQLLDAVDRGILLPLGSVDNLRSLVYLDNLADALVCCATHPDASGRTYHVSDGEDVSTPALIRRIATALGKPARLLPFPQSLLRLTGSLIGKRAAVDRILGSLVIDSGKIRRELGWRPPFSMTEGLQETANWFATQREHH